MNGPVRRRINGHTYCQAEACTDPACPADSHVAGVSVHMLYTPRHILTVIVEDGCDMEVVLDLMPWSTVGGDVTLVDEDGEPEDFGFILEGSLN